MPIRLRFALHGKRHNRIFHLVAINSRRARNDKPTELLGIYNPHVEPIPKHRSPYNDLKTPGAYERPFEKQTRTFEWSVDRIRYWLAVGAQPSASVARLLEKGGILSLDSPYASKKLVGARSDVGQLEGVANSRKDLKAEHYRAGRDGPNEEKVQHVCERCGSRGHAVHDCTQAPPHFNVPMESDVLEAVIDVARDQQGLSDNTGLWNEEGSGPVEPPRRARTYKELLEERRNAPKDVDAQAELDGTTVTAKTFFAPAAKEEVTIDALKDELEAEPLPTAPEPASTKTSEPTITPDTFFARPSKPTEPKN